jgi:hypothetical protein
MTARAAATIGIISPLHLARCAGRSSRGQSRSRLRAAEAVRSRLDARRPEIAATAVQLF